MSDETKPPEFTEKNYQQLTSDLGIPHAGQEHRTGEPRELKYKGELEFYCQQLGVPRRVFEGTGTPTPAAEYQKWAEERDAAIRARYQKAVAEAFGTQDIVVYGKLFYLFSTKRGRAYLSKDVLHFRGYLASFEPVLTTGEALQMSLGFNLEPK